MCEELLKDYIINLDIISRIPRNGQLDTTGPSIDIYSGGVFAWLNRKFMGDGKEETVKFLNTFYSNLKKFANDYAQHAKKRDLCSLVSAIENSKSGLINLSETYKKYTRISVAIDNIYKIIIVDIISDIGEKRPGYNSEESKQKTILSESDSPVSGGDLIVPTSSVSNKNIDLITKSTDQNHD